MSARVSVPYDTGDGLVCLMSIGEDQASATNQSPGDSTHAFHVVVSGSPRAFGIIVRGLSLTRTIGSGSDTATKSSFVPIGNIAAFTAYEIGAEVTIGGVTWTISGKRSQNYN